MTTKPYWLASGDSITGPTGTWFYQYLGVTSLGDATQITTMDPYTYTNGVLIARNVGIAGTRLNTNGFPDLVPLAPSHIDTVPAVKALSAGTVSPPTAQPIRKYIFSCSIGSNDGATGSHGTGNSALYAADVGQACKDRRTAGYDRLIISTLLPRTDGGMLETDRLAYNAKIKDPTFMALWGIDGIFDFASDAIMGDPATCSNSTYYNQNGVNGYSGISGLHPTFAGHTLLVPYVTSTMNAIIAGL